MPQFFRRVLCCGNCHCAGSGAWIVGWVGRDPGLFAVLEFLEFDDLSILYGIQPTVFRAGPPPFARTEAAARSGKMVGSNS